MDKQEMKLLFTEGQIRTRAAEIAACLNRKFQGQNVLCVCVLRGAVMFFTDLIKELTFDVVCDFITLSSYENEKYTSGSVKLVHDLRESVEGRHVLIVEDIVDSGHTINYLRKYFAGRNAADVTVVCLLNKPFARTESAEADYAAFTLDKECFVVGYGLDSAQLYRNLPAVYRLI